MRHELTAEERSRGRLRYRSPVCRVPGCGRQRPKEGGNYGMCSTHGKRFYLTGTPANKWGMLEIDDPKDRGLKPAMRKILGRRI